MAVDELADGERVYVDRTYVYRDVPASLQGQTYIRTGSGDQAISGNPAFLTFDLSHPAEVFVAYNGLTPPSWLTRAGFAATGDSVVVAKAREVNTYFLYGKSYPAGTVTLGSNEESGRTAQMYTVFVRPAALPPVAGAGEVSTISAASGRPYLAVDELADGERVYVDRTYVYRDVPASLQGQTYIRTANGDQAISGDPAFLTFNLSRPAEVFVAYNGSTPPSWLMQAGFAATGDSLVVAKAREVNTYFLYARSYPAGMVTLGSNEESGRKAQMYTVLVRPGSAPPVAGDDADRVEEDTPHGFAAVVRGIRPRGFGQGTYSLRAPASGGRTYHVAPSGNDRDAGTLQAPFRTINKAAQVARAGDAVTIGAGTYRESVSVQNAGTSSRPIVFQAAERGSVVLTGGQHNFVPAGYHGGVQQDGAVYITIRGLVFRDYARKISRIAQRAGVGAIRGWTIEDCLFTDAGYSGLDIRGDSVTVLRSTFEDHHTLAFTAIADRTKPLLSGTTISDVVIRRNNTRPDPISGAASTKVTKFYRTTETLIDNVESYANNGPGIWFDTNNTHFVVRNSYIHSNLGPSGRGLYIEISRAPALVENNVFANNSLTGVTVANSRGVTITNNLFVGNPYSVHLVSASRGASYGLKDVTITHNFFKDWVGASNIHPGGVEVTTPAQMRITVDHNTYDAGSVSELSYWKHTGWIRSLDEVRAKLGWEMNGTTAPISSPL